MIIIIMGVSGSGKSAIGSRLAAALDCPFYEGDDFHPAANVAKMRAGIPLTDADRQPWLERLRALIASLSAHHTSAVIACSALKTAYRAHLRGDDPAVRFVYLKGDYQTIQQRLAQREGHYMPASLLDSQFQALEEPTDALIVDLTQPPETIVATIIQALESAKSWKNSRSVVKCHRDCLSQRQNTQEET